MSRLINMLILILVVFIFSNIFAQIQDSTATQQNYEPARSPATGDVVDLTEAAIEIKLEPDRPLVQIMTVRLKPEFDDVNLEKSFIPELEGQGEKISIIENPELQGPEVIDLDKMLNKKR